MSCFHPLKGFKIGVNPSGKPMYKITSYDTEFLKFENGVWKDCRTKIKNDLLTPVVTESIDIPCGHCIGCYLDRSRQWADRCMLEARYHDFNCFVTLTIDDEHLFTKTDIIHKNGLVWHPLKNYIINSDGVVVDSPIKTLRKSDLQLFMKRLRKAFPDVKIRFFSCGEYGSKSFRPHYHLILFGVDFHEDRILYKKNFSGDNLFNSPTLSELWPFGYSVICDVTWNTCAYVSRYCLKKRNNDLTELYDSFDLDPEFTLMSRRPGIARQYYDDHKIEIYRTEEIYLGSSDGSKKIRPPKYFDNLYDIDYPSDFQRIKEHRHEFAKYNKEMILSKTELDYIDYLSVCEHNLSSKTRIFNERSNYETSI